MCEALVFSSILPEVTLGLHVPHVYFTEASHMRQMTDPLPKTPKGASYNVIVTLRWLQGKHLKYNII